jgi:hypothetical protein
MTNGDDAGPEADYTKLIPAIWTAIRLLGVYITILGASMVIEDFVAIAAGLGLDSEHSGLLWYRTRPKLFGDAVYLAAGLYLIFGGRWLVSNVFLSASEELDESNNDEDTTG